MKKALHIVVAVAVCLGAWVAEADDRNWDSGTWVQWTDSGTWAEGAVPTAADDVYLNVGSAITIAGTDAQASSVALNNGSGWGTLRVYNNASLTVTGAITDPGLGNGVVWVMNTTPGDAATRLVASSLAATSFESEGYLETDYDITLATAQQMGDTADNLYTQTGGTISSAHDSYGLTFIQAISYSATPNTARYLLDGGTMAHRRIGVGNGNGSNTGAERWIAYGMLTFNNGTLQNWTSNGSTYLQNGNGFLNYTGTGAKDMQLAVHHPLTIELSETGTHTFNAQGASGKIFVSPSVQIVDKSGEAGTLHKIGDGDLIFTGGAPAGAAWDGSAYAVNSWSGPTTVEVGRVAVDFNQIAGYAGSGALTNAYSPESKLVLNGGDFVLTGRANAGATSTTFDLKISTGYNVVGHGLRIGQPATHADLPTGTYVRKVTNADWFTLSHQATAATAGATVDFGAATFTSAQTINDVELQQTATVTVNPAGDSTLLTFGNVTGAGGLTKAGTGTLKLTEPPVYTGPTVVSAGTLEFGHDGSLNGGSCTK